MFSKLKEALSGGKSAFVPLDALVDNPNGSRVSFVAGCGLNPDTCGYSGTVTERGQRCSHPTGLKAERRKYIPLCGLDGKRDK